MIYIAFALIVVGSLAIGAWLVIAGHPWFAMLVILAGSSFSISKSKQP